MRRVGPFLLAAALYTLLTTALTWPLVLHPGTRVANDLGDPLLNIWLMSWNARVLPLTEQWWNAPQFYPAEGVMAFSEHLLGLTPITTPILLATRNPLLAYNAAFFCSFLLSAIAGHMLGWSLTRRHDAALIAGLAFGFAPYRAAQLGHVQVLSTYWMPLALVGLSEFRRDRRFRWLLLFGAAWWLQALACGYYLFFLSVLVGLWLLWFVVGRTWRDTVRVVAVWAAFAALLAPVLYGYWRVHRQYGFRRMPGEIRVFSADVLSVFEAPPNVILWGWMEIVERPESAIFPGVTVLLLIAAGLVVSRRPDRSLLAFFAASAVVMWAMCLGPEPTYMNEPFLPWGPYAWLTAVPGADGVRVPVRFWMLAVLCLSAAGALGLAQLVVRWPRAGRALTALACLGVLADGWQWPMRFPEPPEPRPNRTGAVMRLDLPFIEANDQQALYRSVAHRRPVANGASGFFTLHHAVLKRLMDEGDHDALTHLAQFGDLEVHVELRYDYESFWRPYVAAYPGVEAVHADDKHAAFRVRESAIGLRHRRLEGTPLPIAGIVASEFQERTSLMTDGNLVSRWELGRSQRPGDSFTVDLGVARDVRAVELALGQYHDDYPRKLTIETSVDGTSWEHAWSGSGGGPLLTAAIFHPRTLPLTFPVEHRRARFIRLTQTGADPVFYWSVAELKVFAQ